MTKINLDAEHILDKEERRKVRAQDLPNDIYEMEDSNGRVSFRIQKSKHDPVGSILGFEPEEGLRSKFFYPYLPCIFFDIGASFGIWTLPALAQGSIVYAFEPDPRLIIALNDNIRLNEFRDRFTLVDRAVTDIIGYCSLDELEYVPTITLDSFQERTGAMPDFIKIDVEGLEQKVVEGGLKTIQKFKPRLFIEHHRWLAEKTWDRQQVISNILSDIGYKEERIPLSEIISHSFYDTRI